MAVRKGTVPLPYLEKWRTHKLMTREALSDKSGVSVATILKVENRVVEGSRFSTVVKLAEALGITTDELVYHAPPAMQAAFS